MLLSDLQKTDVAAVIEAAERIVASPDLAGLRKVTVEVMAEVVASPLVAWNEVCRRTGRIEAVTFPVMDSDQYAELGEAFTNHVADHPVIATHQATGEVRPRAISDFVGLAAFRQTGLYHEFYRPLGARDQISFMLPDPELIVGIALNTADGAVSVRQRTICSLLQPVVAQTYRCLAAPAPDAHTVVDFLERRGLTEREVEVMLLVRSPASTKQMAARLGISPRTVDKHVDHALAKLGLSSRLHAVAVLNRLGAPPAP